MPRNRVKVTYEPPNPEILPPWTSLAVVLLEALNRRGVPAELERRIRIARKAGGHGPVELVAFLTAYFAAGSGVGLRPFWNNMLEWGRVRGRSRKPSVPAQLAALVGKSAMCSPASASRALSQVQASHVRGSYEWLLVDVPELLPLLRHPAVLTRDTQGRGWHVFDIDPTSTVLRQRDLTPGDDDLREGKRRADDIAAPGYPGRKRGETQFVRTIVSHAGLGAWIYSQLVSGNGDARGDLAAALDAIVSLMARMDEPLGRCVVRLDGAYGGVPALTALLERGLPFVTRAAQQLIPLQEVQERLSKATWTIVPHGEVHGLRSAAELGTVTLEPAGNTLRNGGSSYAPVTVRAVVSRLPCTGDPGRGVAIENWQYEVFLTVLEPDAWPAAEVVAEYHGRSACENRYAQEDRELALDRVFCFHPDGQELATVVGMMVWNMMIAHGFRADPPPDEVPEPLPRGAVRDDRVSTFPAPKEDEGTPSAEAPPAPSIAEEMPRSTTSSRAASTRASIIDELALLPWAEMLDSRPGWSWDGADGCIRCPDGQSLRLITIGLGERAGGRAAAYFATNAGACRDCPVRDECLQSKTGKQHKQIGVTVDAEVGARLHALLHELPRARPGRSRMRPTPSAPRSRRRSPPRGGHILHPLVESEPGPWAMLPSLFLPASARQRIRALAAQVQMTLAIELTEPHQVHRHPLVAASIRQRRHGRTTWTERRGVHGLPRHARVGLTVLAGRDHATLLFGKRPAKACSAREERNHGA
jgi:hypothetical protein